MYIVGYWNRYDELVRAWIWSGINFSLKVIFWLSKATPTWASLLLEARSLQTTFLDADLTKYHLRIYIYSEIFLNRFPCGMFSSDVLGCSFSHDTVWFLFVLLLFSFVHFICCCFFLQPPIRALLKHDMFLLIQLVSSRLVEKWLRINFATQQTRYIFYILYNAVISVGTDYSFFSDINMEYFKLHGTGAVACKWQFILPNLCIILTWFQLSWYFDLLLFSVVLKF